MPDWEKHTQRMFFIVLMPALKPRHICTFKRSLTIVACNTSSREFDSVCVYAHIQKKHAMGDRSCNCPEIVCFTMNLWQVFTHISCGEKVRQKHFTMCTIIVPKLTKHTLLSSQMNELCFLVWMTMIMFNNSQPFQSYGKLDVVPLKYEF